MFENVWLFSLFTAELKAVLFMKHFASFFVTNVFIVERMLISEYFFGDEWTLSRGFIELAMNMKVILVIFWF